MVFDPDAFTLSSRNLSKRSIKTLIMAMTQDAQTSTPTTDVTDEQVKEVSLKNRLMTDYQKGCQ